MKSNIALKQYLHEVRKLLPCSSTQKKRYLAGLSESIQPYLLEHPDATCDNLYVAFGTPASIVEDYLSNADVVQVSKKFSIKHRIVVGVILIVALLAIALGIIAFVFADDLHDYHNGYDVEFREELPSAVLPSPLEEY